MSYYTVLRLVQNMSILNTPKIYNNIQILKTTSLLKKEYDALSKSSVSFSEDLSLLSSQFLCTIINANSLDEADSIAEQRFTNLVDCIDALSLCIGPSQLKNTGIITYNNIIYYRTNTSVNYPMTISDNSNQPLDFIHSFICKPTPLFNTFIRFCHWQRILKLESNLHMQILMYWFSLEGAIKINENDIIIGKLLNIAGFISGSLGKHIDKEFIQVEFSKPNYREARDKLNSILDNIRLLRNDTVHTGLETSSITLNQQLEYLEVLTYISENLRKYFYAAIQKGITTKEEFWNDFPELFKTSHKNHTFTPSQIFTEQYFLNKVSYIHFEE